MSNNFFFKNRALYKLILQNMVHPDRPQMTIIMAQKSYRLRSG
jgi:hypothetical protein